MPPAPNDTTLTTPLHPQEATDTLPGAGATPPGPTANPGARTAWLSWLRVFSIFAVVAIHSVGHTAIIPKARETVRGSLAILIDIGGVFAVPVFVMISGALLLDPTRAGTPGHFIRHRAGRLLPPLVFWHLWYAALIIWVLDIPRTARQVLTASLNGNLYTALYFFWIVLGLSVVAPVLIPFLATLTRRGVLLTGVMAAAIPVLTISTMQLRGAKVALVETPWTWWLPYLGCFILGWGLRGVVLRGWALAGTVIGTIALGLLTAWQWRNPAAPELLQILSPVSYYGAGVILYSCGMYLSFQGLVQPDGPLRALTRPAAVRAGRVLGDATLGVFALHLTAILLVVRAPVLGSMPASRGVLEMMARLVVVFVGTYVVVLLLRRIPFVRALL